LWFRLCASKGKEIGDRFSQSFGHDLELLEGGSVSASFNQAEKIDRKSKHFRELLLSLFQIVPNLPKPLAEGPAKSRQMYLAPLAKSGVISLREPPNEITGD
jgi:hypothetical protein